MMVMITQAMIILGTIMQATTTLHMQIILGMGTELMATMEDADIMVNLM
jgi:hypothetical protein